ncbi:MAG: DUF1629 domain-containing protein [Planctomycetota bacterium]
MTIALTESGDKLLDSCEGENLSLYEQSPTDVYPSVLPSTPIEFVVHDGPVIEDMPWCPEARVISIRLRELIESIDPGHVQYSDVRFIRDNKEWLDAGPYFIAFATRVVRCHDEAKTTWRRGRIVPEADQFHLDPSRVPANCHIFRPFGRERLIIISHAIRQAMDVEGMKGCCYFDPNDYLPLW